MTTIDIPEQLWMSGSQSGRCSYLLKAALDTALCLRSAHIVEQWIDAQKRSSLIADRSNLFDHHGIPEFLIFP